MVRKLSEEEVQDIFNMIIPESNKEAGLEARMKEIETELSLLSSQKAEIDFEEKTLLMEYEGCKAELQRSGHLFEEDIVDEFIGIVDQYEVEKERVKLEEMIYKVQQNFKQHTANYEVLKKDYYDLLDRLEEKGFVLL